MGLCTIFYSIDLCIDLILLQNTCLGTDLNNIDLCIFIYNIGLSIDLNNIGLGIVFDIIGLCSILEHIDPGIDLVLDFIDRLQIFV